jgi:hypothetical protein
MSVEKPAPSLIQSIALGGAACIFTVNFTHPIETVKTRMQVTGDGLSVVFKNTLSKEGVGSFWKGIVWAWGREGSYASIKLGGYAPVRDAIGAGGKDGTSFRTEQPFTLHCEVPYASQKLTEPFLEFQPHFT